MGRSKKQNCCEYEVGWPFIFYLVRSNGGINSYRAFFIYFAGIIFVNDNFDDEELRIVLAHEVYEALTGKHMEAKFLEFLLSPKVAFRIAWRSIALFLNIILLGLTLVMFVLFPLLTIVSLLSGKYASAFIYALLSVGIVQIFNPVNVLKYRQDIINIVDELLEKGQCVVEDAFVFQLKSKEEYENLIAQLREIYEA